MEIVVGLLLCVLVGAGVFVGLLQQRRERARTGQERAARLELEAYAALDLTLAPGAPARELARDVCAAIARHSPLPSAALLLRDAELRLRVAGSAGFDDLTLLAIDAWGERYSRENRGKARSEQRRSYGITVGPLERFDRTHGSGVLGCRELTVVPLQSAAGAILGAFTVCCQGPRTSARAALPPIESLAASLARSVENAALSERLLRAEKMAGLGQLARGVAHELNNPLTSVLGYAELLAETADDGAVRAHAGTIAAEALRMRRTVEALLEFWRPVTPADAAVDLPQLLRRAAERTAELFRTAGITLDLQVDADGSPCTVLGREDRLLEVFEQLLKNSAQAVAEAHPHRSSPRFSAKPRLVAATEPAQSADRGVRLTLACERTTLQVVVSDTGPGFQKPARVFDPFFTTRQPRTDPAGEEHAQGMGLALSYGIVREHGGEISAFNLTPHGAAVVVELPRARTMRESSEHVMAA